MPNATKNDTKPIIPYKTLSVSELPVIEIKLVKKSKILSIKKTSFT